MSQLRLGVIGAGYLGKIHIRLAKELAGAELVGVTDPVEAARQEMAAEHGVATYADYRELAARIDAAIVAAPTPLHTEIGLELIDRGVHVLMEKPLASTATDARRLVRAASKQQVVLQVGHVERFNPALAAAAPYLADAKYIEATRYTPYTFRSTDVSVVLDLMIHDLDIVQSIVGPVSAKSVEAFGVSVLSPHEDMAQARIVFANGCVANVAASRISYAPQRLTQVWTPTSFACIDFAQRQARVVRPSAEVASRRFQKGRLTAAKQAELKDRIFEELLLEEVIPGKDCNAIAEEQRDFVESITQRRPPRVTGEQGLRALELARLVLASIAAHPWDGHPTGRIGPNFADGIVPLAAPHWDASGSAAHHSAG